MRLALFTVALLFLCGSLAKGQDMKPRIVGQKELRTVQGQPITIQLTDLQVEEDPVDPTDNGQTTPPEDQGGETPPANNGEETPPAADGGTTPPAEEGEESPPTQDPGGEQSDDNEEPDEPDPDDGGTSEDGDEEHDHEPGKKGHGHGKNDNGPDKGKHGHDKDKHGHDKDKDKDKGKKGDKDKGHKGSGRSSYPDGYTLLLREGPNYEVAGNTVSPNSGFTGTLHVGVAVRNNTYTSEVFDLVILVLPAENRPPQITGQVPLSTPFNTPLTLSLAHLTVKDPDDAYPKGFSMEAMPGNHYSLSGLTVMPEAGYTGQLVVAVRVSDGESFSEPYGVTISVVPAENVKPVIAGQRGLKVVEGGSIEIRLQSLVVNDPDNRFPEDFSLEVAEGEKYTVSGNRITPEAGFLGELVVMVTVSDGKALSDPFALMIEVVPAGTLEIIGQKPASIAEDSSFQFTVSDVMVSDPENTWPAGFSIEVLPGPDYDVKGVTVTPRADFSGNLPVSVRVRRGERVAPAFSFLLVVLPVNDAPELSDIEESPLTTPGSSPLAVTTTLQVSDVDDDELLYAEVRFEDGRYERGKDQLIFEPLEKIRGVFEADSGVLYLFGQAPLSDYQLALRSVRYRYADTVRTLDAASPARFISFQVSDGAVRSKTITREVILSTDSDLDIPSAFTPNNDMANDTWKIVGLDNEDNVSAAVRVYDKRGNLVFQTTDLQREWDGQLNGAPLPADVYFYTIEIGLSNRKIRYKGVVSLLR